MKRTVTIAVVGNPNCGKTTLFNALTGARQRVGNWPGVTVEKRVGAYDDGDLDVRVVDLPGTYALGAGQASTDEVIARDHVQSGEADLIVNILDAANLERNLYLTAQLVEMRVPLVVALNMVDVARQHGTQVDTAGLAHRLGCPVVSIVANRGEGLDALKAAVREAAAAPPRPAARISYAPAIEEAVVAVGAVLDDSPSRPSGNPRWLALCLLEGDDPPEGLTPEVRETLAQRRAAAEEAIGDDLDIALADGRYQFIADLTRDVLRKTRRASRTLSDRIDRVVLNRVLGVPIFLAIMYLMFVWTINVGGAFIDFFDIFTGTLLVDGFGAVLGGIGTPDWLTVLLAQGVGGGIQTVATFIPIIGFLYLFLSVLEDSGYMSRAAFVMDRFMRSAGLPGKAFVPLIVGFGCNVPAIMATRTLEHDADRKTAIMMSPFMSCGARLPVYALFAAAFFPANGQNLVFALYLIGILIAVLTGFIVRRTLLPGDVSPLVMELPIYHVPTVRNVLLRTWDRLKTFILRAGRVIVPVVVVLSFLNSIGPDGDFGHEDSDSSVLAGIGRAIVPVFTPMGVQEDNWPATVGVFTGMFAKEAVVGTLDALYSALSAEGEAEDAEPFGVAGGLSEAFASIPANLAALGGSLGDPAGLDVGDIGTVEVAAAEQEVDAGTFGAMVVRFDGQAGAFAYLLFILLYFPCVAAIAAVYRELNLRWTLFVAAWTTGIAYATAVIVYQAATFARHPETSALWIAGLAAVFGAVVLAMRYVGRTEPPVPQAAE